MVSVLLAPQQRPRRQLSRGCIDKPEVGEARASCGGAGHPLDCVHSAINNAAERVASETWLGEAASGRDWAMARAAAV